MVLRASSNPKDNCGFNLSWEDAGRMRSLEGRNAVISVKKVKYREKVY